MPDEDTVLEEAMDNLKEAGQRIRATQSLMRSEGMTEGEMPPKEFSWASCLSFVTSLMVQCGLQAVEFIGDSSPLPKVGRSKRDNKMATWQMCFRCVDGTVGYARVRTWVHWEQHILRALLDVVGRR